MAAHRLAKFDLETLPASPNFDFELPLWRSGLQFIGGIDEAGRGALAGPVAAGVVIFPPDPDLAIKLRGVRDSKQMTSNQRMLWARRLPGLALATAVGMASAGEIDEIGIVSATRLAVVRALSNLSLPPQHLLVDFLNLPDCDLPQTALVKGDARSLSIAAASIMAKTARDELLCQLSLQHPDYGFADNKGYGTLAHRQAILRLGRSPVHRKTFRINDLN